MKAPKVKVVVGSNQPKELDWKQGDTVASVLQRAGVTLGSGQTATLGRVRVKKPAKTAVKPGDTIVVAGKPANG